MLQDYLCSHCHRMVPVWVKPTDPYVCLMCKNERWIHTHPHRVRATNKPGKLDAFATKRQWGIAAAKRLAEELSVQLEVDSTDSYNVREVGRRDGKFVSWVIMYGRLYSRKRAREKKK